MKVTLKIKRFNSEKDAQPWWGEYHLEAEPTDRLLDALNHVKWYQDGTLTYRRSCAHGVCGSDAMLINGRNALACKVLLRNLGTRITVEPMRGFRVIKDLLVDMEGFFEKYRKVKPYLITHSPEPEKERLQSPADRERFDDTTKCILCGACTTSCPSFWANEDYLGPAAIVSVRSAAAVPALSALSSQPAASATVRTALAAALSPLKLNSNVLVPPTRTTEVAAVPPTVNRPAVMSDVSMLLLPAGVNSTRIFSPVSSA